jgi:CubicO group peptidase (beta-lactamase class C family)
MAEVHGTCDARFGGVRAALEASLDAGTDVGASVAVFQHGEPVVDLWGGFADAARTASWERDTITNVWSITKTMTFLCALMLADRGELDLQAPVATYWPEFAEAGKEKVAIRHLLGHTAGLSGWDTPLQAEQLADWDLCTAALAAQSPWWEPGSAPGYHAVTQGYLIGEVVRRITGESLGHWFAREVVAPLGADFFIGLPESEDHRVSPVIPPLASELATLPPLTDMGKRTNLNPSMDAGTALLPWWRRAEIPAANGHGNARSVAAIQSVIAGRGESRGVRLLSAEGTDAIFDVQARGMDLVSGKPICFGMGYGLNNPQRPLGPRACYWGGYGGSVIVMDQETDLTVCYVMNRLHGNADHDHRRDIILKEAFTALA